ncbi:DUF1699 family protein [uncultured Methanolobus sp.]|uniref:DUF1699 family protein n=1 Tax=uncultured Methanolobus sp. TaxID=218300 RepID=UPI0029C98360|nr:DUF1699 family protein [uncultured Methanolobus sp.]
MRMKIVNKDNFDEVHDERIIHLAMRPSYTDIATIIDGSPNLQAIQLSFGTHSYLCQKSKKLLYSKKIIVLSGYLQSRLVNYDGCVVIPIDRILHDKKFKKFTDEELCQEYQISMELCRYLVYEVEYESIIRKNLEVKENTMNKINGFISDIDDITKEFMDLKMELQNLHVKCKKLNY